MMKLSPQDHTREMPDQKVVTTADISVVESPPCCDPLRPCCDPSCRSFRLVERFEMNGPRAFSNEGFGMRQFFWLLAMFVLGDAARLQAADITWRNIGLGEGGWIESLACDPRDQRVVLVDGANHRRTHLARRAYDARCQSLPQPDLDRIRGRRGHGAGRRPWGAGLCEFVHHGVRSPGLLVSRWRHRQSRVARAGTMHNFSYLGGFLGIITASLYLVAERIRLTRRYSGHAGLNSRSK